MGTSHGRNNFAEREMKPEAIRFLSVWLVLSHSSTHVSTVHSRLRPTKRRWGGTKEIQLSGLWRENWNFRWSGHFSVCGDLRVSAYRRWIITSKHPIMLLRPATLSNYRNALSLTRPPGINSCLFKHSRGAPESGKGKKRDDNVMLSEKHWECGKLFVQVDPRCVLRGVQREGSSVRAGESSTTTRGASANVNIGRMMNGDERLWVVAASCQSMCR